MLLPNLQSALLGCFKQTPWLCPDSVSPNRTSESSLACLSALSVTVCFKLIKYKMGLLFSDCTENTC